MRLIDADRLLEDRRMKTYYHLTNGDIAIPVIDIEHAPTVESENSVQTEQTRCKDCKYYGQDIFDRGGFCRRIEGFDCNDDDYCSFAVRKKDDSEKDDILQFLSGLTSLIERIKSRIYERT